MASMKQILVATDGSPAAREAVERGIDLAVERGGEITFLRVLATDYTATRIGPVRPAARRLSGAGDDPALNEARARAQERGMQARLVRVAGEPAKAIAAYAEELDADVVVLGSRGLGPVTGVLAGSVSHALLKRLKRPVLIVPAKRGDVAVAA
jgi:nucleotide-binding universal stress UspA family protein